MTEEQKHKITSLMCQMPYLGGSFTPMRDNFEEGLIKNLEALFSNLTHAAARDREQEMRLSEYREFDRAIKKFIKRTAA